MRTEKYAEKIVTEFIRDITDHIFYDIQHDETLMREYQTQVNSSSLQDVNTTIASKVKEILNLKNIKENGNPKSWLIKSYTCHTV